MNEWRVYFQNFLLKRKTVREDLFSMSLCMQDEVCGIDIGPAAPILTRQDGWR